MYVNKPFEVMFTPLLSVPPRPFEIKQYIPAKEWIFISFLLLGMSSAFSSTSSLGFSPKSNLCTKLV